MFHISAVNYFASFSTFAFVHFFCFAAGSCFHAKWKRTWKNKKNKAKSCRSTWWRCTEVRQYNFICYYVWKWRVERAREHAKKKRLLSCTFKSFRLGSFRMVFPKIAWRQLEMWSIDGDVRAGKKLLAHLNKSSVAAAAAVAVAVIVASALCAALLQSTPRDAPAHFKRIAKERLHLPLLIVIVFSSAIIICFCMLQNAFSPFIKLGLA